MKKTALYSLGPVLALGVVFFIAILAEVPSNLDKAKEKKKNELVEISLPETAKPPEPAPETAADAPDPLADLAPESLSADPSLMDSSFGQGYGTGGGSFGAGNGGLGTSSSQLVGEKTSVDRLARVLQRVAPDYPGSARNKGIAGEVLVKVKISTTGAVEEVKVERATPPGIFEESAIKAVRAWRFEPAFQKGEPVTAWLTQKIRYELN